VRNNDLKYYWPVKGGWEGWIQVDLVALCLRINLPVTAVLARDVDIYWSDAGELASAMKQREVLGHDMRFGPFLLTGASRDGDHMRMPDPQLIGFLPTPTRGCPGRAIANG
jgi:hypothetical protein